MDLVGCGCMGFSFTQKYKNAIISLFDYVSVLGDIGVISYQDFQSRIANNGVSDESEIRMIIPFLLKAKMINDNNCIKTTTGTRIRQLVVNEKFFTEQGIEFIKVLKLDFQKASSEDKNVISKIESLYHNAGLLLFLNLCDSDDYIYKELFLFLKAYKTIDKNEFYILTTMIENSNKEILPNIISDYRNDKIGEIKITKNVNDWQYLTNTLQQFGIIEEDDDKRFVLTNDASKLEIR